MDLPGVVGVTNSPLFDAIVIGAGPGGRGCATRLNDAGLRVAMIENELVGGECPFWACIPSKALLRPPEVVSEARHAAGLSSPDVGWDDVRDYRDYMNSSLDDSAKFDHYSELGIEIIRGRGRIVAEGVVEAADRRLESQRIVVATGSAAAVPELSGIHEVEFWTNREGTALREVPASTIVLGGGPVGVELGQMLSRYGSKVTIVESADRLLARESPAVSERLERALKDDGIEIRTGVSAEGVESLNGETHLHLADGSAIVAARLLVATGRRARVEDIGLDVVGAEHDGGGIKIDARCRAAPGVWAVGDVTGVAQFTHLAAYQARIATADMMGREVRADYRAIPRVVFSDPEVAGVGMTREQAADAGIDVVDSLVEITEVDRTETYGRDLSGALGLLADARRRVLVGAWAVGPLTSEWIHTAVLAIKAEIPVSVLRDTVIQFPTFSEAMLLAVDRLPLD